MPDQSIPLETPTTPCSPSFPLFTPLPTPSRSRQSSLASVQTVVPARYGASPLPLEPDVASPTGSVPIISGPLPLRAALQTTPNSSRSRSRSRNRNRVGKNPQRQRQQRQRQEQPRHASHGRAPPSRGRLRSRSQVRPQIRTVSQGARRSTLTYTTVVSHLSTTLIPLISVTTSLPHPAFPRSLLQYHLLTHAQLDELALYYHQVAPPIGETDQYPVQIPAWLDRDGGQSVGQGEPGRLPLETKRRRWGRFLGLGGCESPTAVTFPDQGHHHREEKEGDDDDDDDDDEQRWLRDLLDMEWKRGLERRREEAEEEERLREKAEGWRERW